MTTQSVQLTYYFDFSFIEKNKIARIKFDNLNQVNFYLLGLKLTHSQAQKMSFNKLKKESEQFFKEFERIALTKHLNLSYSS